MIIVETNKIFYFILFDIFSMQFNLRNMTRYFYLVTAQKIVFYI